MKTKQIVVRKETYELMNNLRVGDETNNSVIWRHLNEVKDNGESD